MDVQEEMDKQLDRYLKLANVRKELFVAGVTTNDNVFVSGHLRILLCEQYKIVRALQKQMTDKLGISGNNHPTAPKS